MPGQTLSDADVFGQTATAAGPKTLSDADVFGTEKTKSPVAKPPQGLDSRLTSPQLDTLRSNDWERPVTQIADMLTTGPAQMAADFFGQIGGRIAALASGGSRKDAAKFGKEFGAEIASNPLINQPLTRLHDWVVGHEPEHSTVDDVMNRVTQLIHKGGRYVQRETGGAIKASDVDLAAEGLMALGGIKGQRAALSRRGPSPEAPAAEPPPETPTAQAAKRDVKADIEAATGIKNPKEAAKAQKARRADARAAFKEDPEYADYLRNYAEQEAQLREKKGPLGAPGAVEGARTPRTGLREGGILLDEEVFGEPETKIETGKPDSLTSALQKTAKGMRFDLTANELAALRSAASKYGRPEILDEKGAPIKQKGAATPEITRLIAGLGLGTALGAYAYTHKEDAGAVGLLAMGTLGEMGGRLALSSALKESDYTLKTLERLPQNRTEFTRQQVMDQLKRPDVSKAEKELVEGVLGDKETVSAKELVSGFSKAARPLRLKPKETQEYADYGLESINRADEFDQPAKNARTTIYHSDALDDTNNHFDDPKYFAHTRSFDEDGVRHVVEVQSDVAQHVKAVPEAERAELQKNLDTLNHAAAAAEDVYARLGRARGLDESMKAIDRFEKSFDPEILPDVKLRIGDQIWRHLSEIARTPLSPVFDVYRNVRSTALGEGGEAVYNLIKDRYAKGDERLGQLLEEVFEAESRHLDLTARELELKLGKDAEPVKPLLKNWYKRIIREELARDPGKPVRFATADTVAKVEGWPDGRDDVRRQLSYMEEEARRWENAREDAPGREVRAREYRRAAEELKLKLQGGPKLSPEHQSIYDRYKSEIEKFLKNELSAKPHTDSQGHTWLEVPPRPAGPTQMFGRADPAALAALAAFTGGALAMHAWSDDPSLVSDVVAGLLASAVTRVSPGALWRHARDLSKAKPLESIGQIANERQSNLQTGGIDIALMVKKVAKLVPDAGRRAAVHNALDQGKTQGLASKELEAYNLLKQSYADIAKAGLASGVLKEALADYATHMWDMNRGTFDRLFGARPTSYGTSPNSPYALHRTFRTIEEGKKAGLKPKSEDAAFVYASYAHSLLTAIENAKAIDAIKAAKSEAGDPYVMRADKAPPSYIKIDNPQMRGFAVHPEIADQMKFIFENPSSQGIPAILETIADVTKRSAVSNSLFHVKALVDVMAAAVPGKAKYFGGAAVGAAAGLGISALTGDQHALRDVALGAMGGYVGPRLKAFATGTHYTLKELSQGSASDLIKRASKSGLTFGVEKGSLVVDDAGRKFYDAMNILQKHVDRIFSPVGIKAGKGVEAYVKYNHWQDDMLWGRLHPGMKLDVWSKTSDILRENSVKRNAKDPNQRILSREEADSIAANYTNDLFGGLNWTKIAMDSQTRIGRMVASSLLSPKGRRVMRIAMFAPDWTISTVRSALAAVDADLVNPLKWGNVVNGLFHPVTRGDLARLYVARSAMYYLTIGDAINYSMSGHHIWENKDPTYIDWGDGRRMQFSKHIIEPVHWLTRPTQQAIGKLGYVPKEILDQAFGTEYLAPKEGKQGQVFAGPRMQDRSLTGRLEHAGKGLVPIPFQGQLDETAAWGFAGMPIYGKTQEQLRELREKKRRQRK